MAPRTCVVFDTYGNADFPAGHELAEHLRLRVAEHGILVTALDLHENAGWCFEASSGGVLVWCMLQSYEPWLLTVEVELPFIHWLRRRHPRTQQQRIADIIRNILASSPHFASARWFTRRELDQYNRTANSNCDV